MKTCIRCGVPLSFRNTTWYRQKNYIHKCNECIKAEKRIQAKERRESDIPEARERERRWRAKLKAENPRRYTAKQMQASARKRAIALAIPIDIDAAYIEELCIENCPILGVRLKYGGGEKSNYSASLDRIDPLAGYTRGNVRVVSLLANLMKNNATPSEMLMFANWALRTYEKLAGRSK